MLDGLSQMRPYRARSQRSRHSLLMMLSLSLSLGCVDRGPESRETNYLYQPTPEATDFSFANNGFGGDEGEEIWARLQVMSGLAEIPAFGLKVNETIAVIRMRFRRDGDGWIAEEEMCRTEIQRPDVPSVETTIPDAFIRSIPIESRALITEGDSVRFAYLVSVYGARLKDPERESLPESLDDPRVYDQDGDQAPGITIRSEGILEGEMHLVQRLKTRLTGRRSGDRIEGVLEWSSEESILWGSNPILENPIPQVPNADETLSYFVALKIDPSWQCEEILQQREQLFWVPEGLSID